VFDAAADDEVDLPPTGDNPTGDNPNDDETGDGPADDDPADDDPADDDPAGGDPAGGDPADDGPGGDPAADGHVTDDAGSAGTVAPAGPAVPGPGRGIGDAAPPAVAARPRTLRKDPEALPIDEAELRAALEAIMLVVDEPVGELQLAQIMEQPAERVAAVLEDISAAYTVAGHGFDLRRAAGGWRLYTRPEYAAYVERFVLDGQSVRLTQAALETLAVVAYKQPVTRSRISVIRGVNCDGVMRTLVTRGLIEECGIESETGAFLYRTTTVFLEKLGLDSVDQLPPLAPFLPDDVEEVLDAQR
jgi:segregation and condensation protein B